MRVTNGMMVTNMLRDITRNQERMDALNKNLSTGKKFLKPSDDPLGVSKSLRLNTDISTIQQFKRNVDDSQSWLSSTETATNSMIDILQRVRELTVQGANGTNSTAERGAISAEVDQLKEQLIHLGNSSYAGSYLFSGYKTDKPLLKGDGTYDLGGADLNNKEVMDVNFGIGDKFGLNFVGQKIFGVMKSSTDLDKEVSQGVIDYTIKGAFSGPSPAGGNLTFDYGDPTIPVTPPTTINIPASCTTINDMVNGLNSAFALDPALKNHVTANVTSGYINIVSDKSLKLSASAAPDLLTNLGMAAGTDAIKENYTLGSGGLDLAAKPLTINPGDAFTISYSSVPPMDISVNLVPVTYSSSTDLQNIADQIQASIDSTLGAGKGIVVQCVNNKLVFNSDLPLTVTSSTAFDLNNLGISPGKTSNAVGEAVKSGEETQLVGTLKQLITDLNTGNAAGIDNALSRIDIHLNNINAIRAEIGVKSNRLELTTNRISDDTLNLQTLLSTNEDADMAEVIMNLKMEENVYKSSLSGGARIIQPSLLDFLR